MQRNNPKILLKSSAKEFLRPEIIFVHGSHRQRKIHQIIDFEYFNLKDINIMNKKNHLKLLCILIYYIIYTKIRKNSLRYILSDGTSTKLLFAHIFSYFSGCPLIVRVRGDNWDAQKTESSEIPSVTRRLRAVLQHRIDDFVIPRAKLVIAVSNYLQDKIQKKFNLPNERLAVLAVPLTDEETLLPSNPTTLQLTGRFILTVTNFNFWKKCGALLKYLSEITCFLEKYPDVKIVIAGNGTHLERMKIEISNTSISDSIIFAGKIENLSSLYRTATAFLHLSHLDSFTNVVVEAQAAGLPTVVNNFPGMTEALTFPGGVAVDESVPGGLYCALDAIFADPTSALTRAAVSREETLRRFSAPAVAAQFRQIVQERLVRPSNRAFTDMTV